MLLQVAQADNLYICKSICTYMTKVGNDNVQFKAVPLSWDESTILFVCAFWKVMVNEYVCDIHLICRRLLMVCYDVLWSPFLALETMGLSMSTTVKLIA